MRHVPALRALAIAVVLLAGTVSAQEIDLSSWSAYSYNFSGGQPAGNWVLSNANHTVTQTINADPSVYLDNINRTSYSMDGSWRVITTADDDFMGFVFGYQDRTHFYLFDWKQLNQNEPGYGQAWEGFSVKKIAAVNVSDLDHPDFWLSAGSAHSTILASNFGIDLGWQDNTTYFFHLDFWADSFKVIVKDGVGTELWNTTVIDGSYQEGQFGFYNYSQENVQYSGFADTSLGLATIEPSPLWYKMAQAVNPVVGQIVIGAFDDRTIGEVDVASLEVNGSIVPGSIVLMESYAGFPDSVLVGNVSVRDFILTYDPMELWDTTLAPFSVSGLFTDGRPFVANGVVPIVSHTSGDANGDGSLNVQDIVIVTGYLFRGASAPVSMEAADMNHDGVVNVADVAAIVRAVFL